MLVQLANSVCTLSSATPSFRYGSNINGCRYSPLSVSSVMLSINPNFSDIPLLLFCSFTARKAVPEANAQALHLSHLQHGRRGDEWHAPLFVVFCVASARIDERLHNTNFPKYMLNCVKSMNCRLISMLRKRKSRSWKFKSYRLFAQPVLNMFGLQRSSVQGE